MNNKFKFFSLLAALLFLGQTAWAQTLPQNWTSGNTDCYLDTDGTFTIKRHMNEPDGAMADYADVSDRPWQGYNSQITRVVVDNDVTVIGARAFQNCYNLVEVVLRENVREIHTRAFAMCEKLPSISIPTSITQIGYETFYHCPLLLNVTCYPNPNNLAWTITGEDFDYGDPSGVHTTNIHVYDIYLADYNSLFSSAPDVTFVGDLTTTYNWTNYGANAFSHVSGNTIYIENEAEFARMATVINANSADYIGKTFSLTRDLNMAAHYWIPIGTASNPFRSDFNGNNHTISGIIVNPNNSDSYNGLFGYVQGFYNDENSGAQGYQGCHHIKDFTLTQTSITGGENTGGVVGYLYAEARLNNVVCYASVAGTNSVGGIVGRTGGYTWGGGAGMDSKDYIPFIQNCLQMGNSITGTNNVKAIIGNRQTDISNNTYSQTVVCISNNYYTNAALGALSNDPEVDFRAYPFTKDSAVPAEVTLGIISSTGVTHNGVLYAKDGSTVNFSVAYPDLTHTITEVFVNGNSVGTHPTNCSYTIDASVASEYWVTITSGTTNIKGTGTEEDPFRIATADDWDDFAAIVNAGQQFSGKHFRLTNNISVTTMVGNSAFSFSGIFDGYNNTLTFNKGSGESAFNEEWCAPFRYTHGTTIKNLLVNGQIYTNQTHAAGLVGHSTGGITISDCIVSMEINSQMVDAEGLHGGFVAQAENQYETRIERCVFEGKLRGNTTSKVGGFVGVQVYSGSPKNNVKIYDCFFVPTEVTMLGTNSGTFYVADGLWERSYYLTSLGTEQGLPLTASTTSGEVYRKHIVNEHTYYSAVTVTGISDQYYTDGTISVTPTLKNAENTTLILNTDYMMTISDSENQTVTGDIGPGDYTLTFRGKGDYVGTKTQEFHVYGLDGAGTEGDPYVIATAEDWGLFDNILNAGRNFNDKFVSLTNNITVSEVAGGLGGAPFAGTFNGNDNTLTFNKGTDANRTSDHSAPFWSINGATIKNLRVSGAIYTNDIYSGGLAVYVAGNTSNIIDCISTVTINSTYSGDANHGGFVVHVSAGQVHFTRCFFNGNLIGSNSRRIGGFVGSSDSNTSISFTDCLFLPITNTMSATNSATYANGNASLSFTRSYYVAAFGNAQGTQSLTFDSTPAGLGALIGTNDFASFYANGILFGGNYYTNLSYNVFTEHTDNLWTNPDNWSKGTVPTADDNVIINDNVTISYNTIAIAGTVQIAGDKKLILENGAQFINSSEDVFATVKKEIEGVGDDWATISKGWYFIASPIVNNLNPTSCGSMLTHVDFDLYRLNNTTWENYKAHYNTDGFSINNGEGYLYANKIYTLLEFTGYLKPYTTESGANQVTLAKNGWNLIGNPYACRVSVDKAFVELINGSAVFGREANYIINPCMGIAVYGNEGDKVTFTAVMPSTSVAPSNGSLNVVLTQVPEPVDTSLRGGTTKQSSTIGNVIVSFNEGSELPKFDLLEGNAKLYIPQNGEDYAIAFSEGQGEMPLNFKAKENGEYTITVNPENVQMNYLHLIDNLTGADIDLLHPNAVIAGEDPQSPAPSYTFTAKTTDYESRFKLVFVADGGVCEPDDAPFAFYNNGNWIIANEGEATLQVIDINGRILSSETMNGCVSKAINVAAGMYVLRLVDGKEARTQKIVVQ